MTCTARRTHVPLSLDGVALLSRAAGQIKLKQVFPFGHAPDGRTLFVANYNSNELQVIDLTRLPLERAVVP